MSSIDTTRGGFTKGIAAGAACVASMGLAGVALAEEEAAGSEFEMADLPDTYAHATDVAKKQLLGEEGVEKVLKFLADTSHYFYVNRATPYYGNYTLFPEAGFDTEWRSPLNGRVYRGAYYDPITRSVIWLTTNPNGSSNISAGSYLGAVPPNTELEINHHELEGCEPSDKVTDRLLHAAWPDGEQLYSQRAWFSAHRWFSREPLWHSGGTGRAQRPRRQGQAEQIYSLRGRPQDYYDGLIPTTHSWQTATTWGSMPGWGPDAGEDKFRTNHPAGRP